jgi:hypothetical protein
MSDGEISSFPPPLLPACVDNYQHVLAQFPIVRYILNSFTSSLVASANCHGESAIRVLFLAFRGKNVCSWCS